MCMLFQSYRQPARHLAVNMRQAAPFGLVFEINDYSKRATNVFAGTVRQALPFISK